MPLLRRFSASLLSLTLLVGVTGSAFAFNELAVIYATAHEMAEALRPRNLSPSGFEGASPTAPTAAAGAAVFKLNNFSDPGNEPGEPSLGGKMKKTAWGKLTLTASSRVVIHTFGSDFDTVLAAYTGNAVNALTAVTSNDDRAVPGFGNNTQSLIQFNAVANTKYSIQFGSKTNVNGNIYAGAFVFPPTGGLSAFMAKVGSTVWNSRDYVCNDAHTVTCGNPLFILHNSTNKTLTVTASSNLGAGVTAPAVFTIAPNAIKTARFTFTGAFNTTTTRTVSGLFTFIGRENGTEISRAQHRALIVVGNATLVLGASVSPAVRAGFLNETKPFDAKLTNTTSQTAIGCHARHDFASARLKVTWIRTDPNTGGFIGALNQPFNIAAGQSVTFRVFVASQQTQLADPEFPTKVTLDCANANPAPINLFNTFDLTAFGIWRPAQVDATKLAPLSDTLLVPATGSAQVRFSVINRSVATALRAIPIYIRPIGDWGNPNKQYQLTMCRLNSANGSCLSPPAFNSIEYNAAKDTPAFFKIFVTAPPTNPGYSPGFRRVFLKVWQDSPHPQGFDAVVAAESVAVKKN
jgi:hypothetical protein